MLLLSIASVNVEIVHLFFFFNDTATTEIYTLSLHDALPISGRGGERRPRWPARGDARCRPSDRKSTRLNSSHANISYAVFCLKKKKTKTLLSRKSLIVSLTYSTNLHAGLRSCLPPESTPTIF